MNQCCVIGGAGFIGRYVVEGLLERGRRVTVLDKNASAPRIFPAEVRCVCGDYGEGAVLRDALEEADEIINLAYATVPSTSVADPVRDILTNLPAAIGLFEFTTGRAVRKIVNVSSGGTVYGSAQTLPIAEGHPTDPISPYGVTKLAIEKYAFLYHRLKGLPIVTVRPANAFGERQQPFTGQGFVATAIASILRGEEVVLYGESGTIRDYIHVVDLANGIAAALEHGQSGSFYNLGSGVGRSNKEILDAIRPLARSAGLEVHVKVLPPRGFDVGVNILNSQKLEQETGWKARVSFAEGLERTWNWFYDNHRRDAGARGGTVRNGS